MSAQPRGGDHRDPRAVSVGRIAKTAVALLRGDVGIVQFGSVAALAASDAIDTGVAAHQLANPVVALEQGYLGQVSVPLWQHGRRIGTLAVLSRRPRTFSNAEIALLRELSEAIQVSGGRAAILVH
ncbi:GAF domain-containing protein [Sphingomonas sp. HT-1]|uniref:GAF domain-containing protein n=1 Tax=unclassified Sphingomonas TaxID=196159 RepID=UPI00128FB9B8|nr:MULTISPECIES: GAF domain-containing protein [unclassified Sphingomonas]